MLKEAFFTMKLEPELRDAFMAEAEAAQRPASLILRDLMREFIQRQKDTREYKDYLYRKLEIARASMNRKRGRSDAEVSADFADKRAKLLRFAGKSQI